MILALLHLLLHYNFWLGAQRQWILRRVGKLKAYRRSIYLDLYGFVMKYRDFLNTRVNYLYGPIFGDFKSIYTWLEYGDFGATISI